MLNTPKARTTVEVVAISDTAFVGTFGCWLRGRCGRNCAFAVGADCTLATRVTELGVALATLTLRNTGSLWLTYITGLEPHANISGAAVRRLRILEYTLVGTFGCWRGGGWRRGRTAAP